MDTDRKWVTPASERAPGIYLTKEDDRMIRLLSASTGLPIVTLVQVLIELGMPHLTPEKIKYVKEQRQAYKVQLFQEAQRKKKSLLRKRPPKSNPPTN